VNDLSVGRSVGEMLRLLEAFKSTEKYGVVCPANWNPGEDTITPTMEGKQAYVNRSIQNVLSDEPGYFGTKSGMPSPMAEYPPPMEQAFKNLSARASATASPVPSSMAASLSNVMDRGLGSPLPSPALFGHKKTLSTASRQSYFD